MTPTDSDPDRFQSTPDNSRQLQTSQEYRATPTPNNSGRLQTTLNDSGPLRTTPDDSNSGSSYKFRFCRSRNRSNNSQSRSRECAPKTTSLLHTPTDHILRQSQLFGLQLPLHLLILQVCIVKLHPIPQLSHSRQTGKQSASCQNDIRRRGATNYTPSPPATTQTIHLANGFRSLERRTDRKENRATKYSLRSHNNRGERERARARAGPLLR